ncbi:hypothetical protein RN51_01749 [Microbacterium oxydans]|uniref:Uncharacterized protein n=1 Tax=Microbacterium oxydans TaxID=82380 RepID=A0A0F0KNF9_9MICO|nr:hypothetical protein RN51_01749 [Microbacterium oxydans]
MAAAALVRRGFMATPYRSVASRDESIAVSPWSPDVAIKSAGEQRDFLRRFRGRDR